MLPELLDFSWKEDLTDSSFVLGEPNLHVYRWLQNIHIWPTKHTIIVGPHYSGKTHLANIWALSNKAEFVQGANDFVLDPNISYVIDSLDKITDEEYLMRIFYQTNKEVLWLADSNFLIDDIKLKDLKSRLSAMIKIKIHEPDEVTFKKILKKRCKDFGLNLTAEVLEYLLRRMEITYETINFFVKILHNECLVQQKIPSIVLIHSVLEKYPSFGGSGV